MISMIKATRFFFFLTLTRQIVKLWSAWLKLLGFFSRNYTISFLAGNSCTNNYCIGDRALDAGGSVTDASSAVLPEMEAVCYRTTFIFVCPYSPQMTRQRNEILPVVILGNQAHAPPRFSLRKVLFLDCLTLKTKVTARGSSAVCIVLFHKFNPSLKCTK